MTEVKCNTIHHNELHLKLEKKQTKQQRTLQCKKKKKKKLCKEGGNYTTLMNSHKLWQILYTLKGSFFRPHQYPLLTLATFKSIPPLGGGGKGGGAERRSSVATFRFKNIKNISLQKKFTTFRFRNFRNIILSSLCPSV